MPTLSTSGSVGERGRESAGRSESEQAAEEVGGVGSEHLEGHRPPGQAGREKFSAHTKSNKVTLYIMSSVYFCPLRN